MAGQQPRGHSHPAPLRAQEHIATSNSVLSSHVSSKIFEPSMIVTDPAKMERWQTDFVRKRTEKRKAMQAEACS